MRPQEQGIVVFIGQGILGAVVVYLAPRTHSQPVPEHVDPHPRRLPQWFAVAALLRPDSAACLSIFPCLWAPLPPYILGIRPSSSRLILTSPHPIVLVIPFAWVRTA